MKKRIKIFKLFLMFVIAVLIVFTSFSLIRYICAVSGCRPNQADREIQYEMGVYRDFYSEDNFRIYQNGVELKNVTDEDVWGYAKANVWNQGLMKTGIFAYAYDMEVLEKKLIYIPANSSYVFDAYFALQPIFKYIDEHIKTAPYDVMFEIIKKEKAVLPITYIYTDNHYNETYYEDEYTVIKTNITFTNTTEAEIIFQVYYDLAKSDNEDANYMYACEKDSLKIKIFTIEGNSSKTYMLYFKVKTLEGSFLEEDNFKRDVFFVIFEGY